MTKKAAAPTTTSPARSPKGTDSFTIGTLGLDLLDTTWRIVVPVLAFTTVGIFADIKFGTKPWLTLLALVAGFGIAGVLIKKLLQAVEKEDRTS